MLLTLVLSSLISPPLISSVRGASCSATCDFEADTNVPTTAGIVRVRLDGSTNYNLNHTFTFGYNTTHTFEVLDLQIVAPSGGRYVFKQWSHNGIQWSSTPILAGNPFPILANFKTGDNGPFVAEFEAQFQVSLSFTDPVGQSITPPSVITLQGPSTVTLSSYTGQWLSAGVWTVTDATWQNVPSSVYGVPTVDLTSGPQSVQIPLKAYSAAVKVVDNSNNPVAGASLTVTLYNNTVVTATTDSQGMAQLGHIPLGPYSVQGQNIPLQVADASTDPNGVFTITLNQGTGPSAPVVSALVLLTIFGLAVFLLVLAIKVRKPPPPPTI